MGTAEYFEWIVGNLPWLTLDRMSFEELSTSVESGRSAFCHVLDNNILERCGIGLFVQPS